MHDFTYRGSLLGLFLVSCLAAACDSSTNDAAFGGQDPASCLTLPCVRVLIYSGGAVPKGEHVPILGAIACYPSEESGSGVSGRFELDVAARTGVFDCDNEAGNLHLRGQFTSIGAAPDAEGRGHFGEDSRIVLTASGDLVGKLGSDAEGAGVDLMPGLDEQPFSWTLAHGEVFHEEALGRLPVGVLPENSLVNFEVTVWIPWTEP